MRVALVLHLPHLLVEPSEDAPPGGLPANSTAEVVPRLSGLPVLPAPLQLVH